MLAILLQGGTAQAMQNATMAITVIPLLILYLGLIAWLTYDASQDSSWVVWLLLFLIAGPISIPFYIFSAYMARRGTPQDVLDARADEMKNAAKAFKFASDIDKMKWADGLDPARGTMFEPSVGLSLRRDRHEQSVHDERADWLLASGSDAEAFEYLTGMYAIAGEQGDLQRAAGYRRLIETRLHHGAQRLAHWEQTGLDLSEFPEEPRPTRIEPPKPPPQRPVPF